MTEWDARYSEKEFAYGTAPNEFLAQVADRIPTGPVLCLAEGQGRNAVYLAEKAHRVVAVDQSAVGLARARELAGSRRVNITTVVADLSEYVIEPGAWSAIVCIFAHVPPPLRRNVHAASVAGLAPGGVFILEAYTPSQLAFGTGGPSTRELLMTLAELESELAGLEFVIARELERPVLEGSYHRGQASVVQILGRKPVM